LRSGWQTPVPELFRRSVTPRERAAPRSWPPYNGMPGGPAKAATERDRAAGQMVSLAVWSPRRRRRLSASASSEQDPLPSLTGLYIEPDEVDYVVKPTAGTGSNAASGNGEMPVLVPSVCRDRFVSRFSSAVEQRFCNSPQRVRSRFVSYQEVPVYWTFLADRNRIGPPRPFPCRAIG
jgi:hypothetical protein